MSDPAAELTLHDRLTAAFTGALEEMFRPEVGHSCTGDLPALADDAKTLAKVAEKTMGDVWERGRKHGLRQAWKPQLGRVKQLEEEIENMLVMQEDNSKAFLNRWERSRELEAKLDAVRKVHTPVYGGPDNSPTCRACRTSVWPCPTLQAAE